MAAPCNGIRECIDGSDENGCKFPNWLLPTLLSLAAVVLGLTCFISLQRHVKRAINEIMQDRRWRVATQNTKSQIISMASEKLMKVAIFVRNEPADCLLLMTNLHWKCRL